MYKLLILATFLVTGCAVHPGAPVIHESTTYEYNHNGQQGITRVQDDYVTSVPVLHMWRSYELVKYYEVQYICRQVSNTRPLPTDHGAVAKQKCAAEEVPRQRRVQNGWIVRFKFNDVIYEQYVAFNPGGYILIRVSNNSIVGVEP